MNFREVLANRLTIKEVHLVCDALIQNKEQFAEFFQLIFQGPYKIAWQAAWICEKVSEVDTSMFTDEDYRQLIDFTLTNKEDSLQRLCLSVLFNLPFRKPLSVKFINNCFEQMISPKKPVGVQVLSMKILHKICLVEPGFTDELLLSLENLDYFNYSAGFVAARNQVIKSLIKSMIRY